MSHPIPYPFSSECQFVVDPLAHCTGRLPGRIRVRREMEAIAAAEAALHQLRVSEIAHRDSDARSAALAVAARAAEARADELAGAAAAAEALVSRLSARVALLEHERAEFAARAAKLRVDFERELRQVEHEAAEYARCVRSP